MMYRKWAAREELNWENTTKRIKVSSKLATANGQSGQKDQQQEAPGRNPDGGKSAGGQPGGRQG
jgi:hypothetical protein